MEQVDFFLDNLLTSQQKSQLLYILRAENFPSTQREKTLELVF